MRRFFASVLSILRIVIVVAMCGVGVRSFAESTFKLTTGEIVKGDVLSKSAKGVLIKTAYAEFLVPYQLIDNEEIGKVEAKKSIADIPESAEVNMPLQESEIMAQQVGLDELPEYAPLFDDSGSSNRVPDLAQTLKSWQQEYKSFISDYIPEGWYIRLRGGYLITQSTTSENTINLGFDIEREWDVHKLTLSGYYNYTLYTDTRGVSTPTTNKNGLSYIYHWKFLGKESDWYLNSSLAYKSDAIKLINTQADQIVGVGYAYEVKEWGLKTSIDSGPTIRYLDISKEATRFIPAWSFSDSIYWDITDLLRLEHTLTFTLPVNSSNDLSAYIMIGLVFAPKEVVSIALRYTGDYDNTTTIKYEERFIISLEIPLDGRTPVK